MKITNGGFYLVKSARWNFHCTWTYMPLFHSFFLNFILSRTYSDRDLQTREARISEPTTRQEHTWAGFSESVINTMQDRHKGENSDKKHRPDPGLRLKSLTISGPSGWNAGGLCTMPWQRTKISWTGNPVYT